MTKIIMIHSFRRGVGRSTMIANISALLAIAGKRVGVIDTNIQSPSLHFFFDLNEADIGCSLNNYLWGTCTLAQATHHITLRSDIPGQIFLIPGTCQPHEIVRVLSNSYSLHPLDADIESWCEEFGLDVLLIDPRSGLIEMAAASIAVVDTLVLLMRLDRQDFEGTGMMLDLIKKVDISKMLLVVNEVPGDFGLNMIRKKVEQTLQYDVTAVVPYSGKLLALGSKKLFVLEYPQDPLTELYGQIAEKFVI